MVDGKDWRENGYVVTIKWIVDHAEELRRESKENLEKNSQEIKGMMKRENW